MTERKHGDTFTCIDCNSAFDRRGVVGGIPLRCDECRRRAHVAAQGRYRARNPDWKVKHADRARARRREARGDP